MNPLLKYKDNIKIERVKDGRYKLDTDIDIIDVLNSWLNEITDTDKDKFSFTVNTVLLDTILCRFITDIFIKEHDVKDKAIVNIILKDKSYNITIANQKQFNGYIYSLS